MYIYKYMTIADEKEKSKFVYKWKNAERGKGTG